MLQVMPPQADWLKASVSEFRPEENTVVTGDGQTVRYDWLIVALGLQVNFNKVTLLLHVVKTAHEIYRIVEIGSWLQLGVIVVLNSILN